MTSIIPATPQTRRAYDHRLREHVVRSGATSLGHRFAIPRSTISTWQRRGLRPVVTLEPLDHDPQRLLDSIARLDRQARILAAVVRLLLAMLRASGFSLVSRRLPDGAAKADILRAIESAQPFLPLAIILRVLRLEPAHYYAWRRDAVVCDLDDRPSCPRTNPGQLTAAEVATIKSMVLTPNAHRTQVAWALHISQYVVKFHVTVKPRRCS